MFLLLILILTTLVFKMCLFFFGELALSILVSSLLFSQESAMTHKKAKTDPLRSASKATMQPKTCKRAHKESCNSPRAAL